MTNADLVAALAALTNTCILVWREARNRMVEQATESAGKDLDLDYGNVSKEAVIRYLRIVVTQPRLTNSEIAKALHYSEGYVTNISSFITRSLGISKKDF